jgi:hypothetical protein
LIFLKVLFQGYYDILFSLSYVRFARLGFLKIAQALLVESGRKLHVDFENEGFKILGSLFFALRNKFLKAASIRPNLTLI